MANQREKERENEREARSCVPFRPIVAGYGPIAKPPQKRRGGENDQGRRARVNISNVTVKSPNSMPATHQMGWGAFWIGCDVYRFVSEMETRRGRVRRPDRITDGPAAFR